MTYMIRFYAIRHGMTRGRAGVLDRVAADKRACPTDVCSRRLIIDVRVVSSQENCYG